MTLRERIRSAIAAFQEGPPEPRVMVGEVGYADARRIPQTMVDYNPSSLVGRRGIDLFTKMRSDDQVKAALKFKKLAVISTGWTVSPPEGAPEDDEVTRFVQWSFDRLQGTFDRAVLGMLSNLDYGFSITEKVFAEKPWEGEERLALVALKTRRPRDFEFEVDVHGNVTENGLRQHQARGTVSLPREKFVHLTNDDDFGNPYGTSDLEAAYRPWWIKDNSYRWLGMLLERFGIPPIFAMYDPGFFKGGQLETLKKSLKNLQANTVGVVPRGSTANRGGDDVLQFWSPELASGVEQTFIPALDTFNRDIARSVLMPGLLGVTPEESVGSQARAQTVFDVFMLVVEQIREYLTRVVNDEIVGPMVALNFAGAEERPEFRFMPLLEDDRAELFSKWVELVEKGVVRATREDERHVRATMEFPEREGDDDPPAAAIQMGREEEAREPSDDDALPEDADDDVDPTEEAFVYAQTPSLERLGPVLDAVEESGISDLTEVLEREVAAIGRRIDDLLEGDVYEFGREGRLSAAVGRTIRQAYADGRETARAEVPDTFAEGDSTAGATGAAAAAAGGAAVAFRPKAAEAWLRAKRFWVTGVLVDRVEELVRGSILKSVETGEVRSKAFARVKETLKPYMGDPGVLRDGGAELTPWRVETIVRTNTTDAFNHGRLVEFLRPSMDRIIPFVRYSAITDTRTTEVCRFLDGRVFRREDPELARLKPPNHFNCRSVLAPVTIGTKVDEESVMTVADASSALDLAGEGFV